MGAKFKVAFNLVFLLTAIVGLVLGIAAENLNGIVANGFLLIFWQHEFHRALDERAA